MLELLEGYKGKLEVNGVVYSDITQAIKALGGYNGQVKVRINTNPNLGQIDTQTGTSKAKAEPITNLSIDIFKIKVRQYMIKPSSREFDFHKKWNNDVPMPMRIMVGKIIQETPGMYKMELWGEITEEVTSHCMKCGKVLTNPVSQYFGIGPECGGHNYVNPFETDAELKAAVATMQKQLRETKWTGWVIKSAIEEKTFLRKEGEQ